MTLLPHVRPLLPGLGMGPRLRPSVLKADLELRARRHWCCPTLRVNPLCEVSPEGYGAWHTAPTNRVTG